MFEKGRLQAESGVAQVVGSIERKLQMQAPVLVSKNAISLHEDGFHAALYTKDENIRYYIHYHDYYEIVIYLSHKPLTYLCGDREYEISCGDIVLCDIFEPHVFLCEKNNLYDRFSVGIEPGLLLQYSSEDSNLLQIFCKSSSYYPIFHLDEERFCKYRELIKTYKKLNVQNGEKAVQRALVHQFFAYLYSDCCIQPGTDSVQTDYVRLVSELVHCVDRHLGEQIRLEQLAEEVNYSVAYICRIFKAVTGKTLIQYYLEKRIVWAKQLIKSGLSVTEAANRAGFANYSYFYRAFKRMTGLSPREYQKRWE